MPHPPADYVVGIADVDASRRHKLIRLPEIIKEWVEPHGGLAGRRVLDFGCGYGEMAAGIALHCDPAVVLGIDINDQPTKGIEKLEAMLGKNSIPSNLLLEQVKDGEFGSFEQVDVIVSWSVMEHVSRNFLPGILDGLYNLLSSGGLMMLQISPLYFSPHGAHLWSCGYQPWEHLEKSSSQVLTDIQECETLNDNQRSLVSSMFIELNRLTAAELSELVTSVGFEIVREQLDYTTDAPPPSLLSAYTNEALTNEQVVYLMRKV